MNYSPRLQRYLVAVEYIGTRYAGAQQQSNCRTVVGVLVKCCHPMNFYRILSGPDPLTTFEKDRAWHVPEELDLVSMQQACRILAGHHDLCSFRVVACQEKSPIRTLDELNVTEVVSTPYFPSILERQQSDALEGLSEALNSKAKFPCSVIPSQVKLGGSDHEARHEFAIRRRHRCLVVIFLMLNASSMQRQ